MSETLYPPPRPLAVSEVLDLSVKIYRRTFVKCLLFGALAIVANWLPNLYSLVRGQTLVRSIVAPTADIGLIAATILGVLLAFTFPMAILYRQYKLVTGQSPGGELMRGVRLLGRFILFSILAGLAVAACALCVIPAFLVNGVLRYVLLAVLLLPMFYVIIRLACGLTAMVVENTSARTSLDRSWQLSRGNVMRLAAIYTVAFFLIAAAYFAVGSVAAFLYAALGKGDVALVAAAVGVITVAVGAVAGPYYSALGLAVFGDLVVRREGADLAQRISAA
jgi:Membrane domain of glycerophosphoryl diester phosphodiesterase